VGKQAETHAPLTAISYRFVARKSLASVKMLYRSLLHDDVLSKKSATKQNSSFWAKLHRKQTKLDKIKIPQFRTLPETNVQ